MEQSPNAFPFCAVTPTQARKLQEVVDLSDSFLVSDGKKMEAKIFFQPELKLPVAESKSDPSLTACVAAAIYKDRFFESGVAFHWEDEVLMRRWKKNDIFCQVVVSSEYCVQILKLAHDRVLSSHLGIRKTYKRVLRYFFGPGMKSDVSAYCRLCNACQLTGKPNQTIPPAPLHPIPLLGEPFEHIIMDYVGPLPKSKAGHQYILTIMCAAT